VSLRLLGGVRVLDLAGVRGAQAGRILADLGADVVMIEPPDGGEPRRAAPLVRTAAGVDVSPHFVYMSAGKRSVTLDIAPPQGYALFSDLVRIADVVIVTESSDSLRARRLDFGSLSALNERLIYASLTPFGASGPRRRWQGSDLVAWAASGGLGVLGDPDRRPLAPGGALAYAAGSLNLAAGTVLALAARRRSGKGQMVDVSLQEAVLSVTMESGPFFPLEGAVQTRLGARRGPAQGQFPTRDGFVELLPFMPGQWDALAEWITEELEIREATMDTFKGSVMVRVPYADLIEAWVSQLTSRYTKQAFFVEAQRRGIPCGPVNDPSDLLSDPQLEAVDGWVHGEIPGVGPARWPRPPLRFSGESMDTGRVPGLGEHNRSVYGGELGLTDDRLDELRAAGVI
jgi:crotonobetainyl-CoA:carnitine CoA-transferase CaiB-like acyl-CoA transferase